MNSFFRRPTADGKGKIVPKITYNNCGRELSNVRSVKGDIYSCFEESLRVVQLYCSDKSNVIRLEGPKSLKISKKKRHDA